MTRKSNQTNQQSLRKAFVRGGLIPHLKQYSRFSLHISIYLSIFQAWAQQYLAPKHNHYKPVTLPLCSLTITHHCHHNSPPCQPPPHTSPTPHHNFGPHHIPATVSSPTPPAYNRRASCRCCCVMNKQTSILFSLSPSSPTPSPRLRPPPPPFGPPTSLILVHSHMFVGREFMTLECSELLLCSLLHHTHSCLSCSLYLFV